MGNAQFSETQPFIRHLAYTLSAAPADVEIAAIEVLPRRIDALWVYTTATADWIVQVSYEYGGAAYPRGQITIPALTGQVGHPPIDLVPLLCTDAEGGFLLDTVHGLFVRCVTAPAGGGIGYFIAEGGYL